MSKWKALDVISYGSYNNNLQHNTLLNIYEAHIHIHTNVMIKHKIHESGYCRGEGQRATGWGEKPIHGYKWSLVLALDSRFFLNNVFLIKINELLKKVGHSWTKGQVSGTKSCDQSHSVRQPALSISKSRPRQAKSGSHMAAPSLLAGSLVLPPPPPGVCHKGRHLY